MTNIYIKHANGEIMEVQNWATLTDYGAMVTRPLEPDERERYLALKSIRLRDSEIWRLFHPHPPKSSPSSPSESKFSHTSSYDSAPDYSTVVQSFEPHPSHSGDTRSNRSTYGGTIDVQIQNIPKQNKVSSEPAIKISIKDLSRRALLHIIQKACSRDIDSLKTATHDELISLASAILPTKGVRITVIPSIDPLASCA